MYIWQRKSWPDLTWDSGRLATLLGQVSREQGRLLGRMQDLGFDLRLEAQLSTLTEDVPRYPGSRRARRAAQGPRWRAEHELLAGHGCREEMTPARGACGRVPVLPQQGKARNRFRNWYQPHAWKIQQSISA
jgi:Domain of unknown function (DUF4172)